MIGESDILKRFGQRIRSQREAEGISQERLADLTGLHRTYVGSVERGERNIALLNILRLAEGLRIDAGQLVSGLSA